VPKSVVAYAVILVFSNEQVGDRWAPGGNLGREGCPESPPVDFCSKNRTNSDFLRIRHESL